MECPNCNNNFHPLMWNFPVGPHIEYVCPDYASAITPIRSSEIKIQYW